MTNVRQTLYAIGKIVKPFGIKGEVVVEPLTDSVDRFRKTRRVFLGATDGDATETHVTSVTLDHRGVRMSLAGIADRTAAEKIVGMYVFVQESERVRLPRGRYFVDDIVGLAVVDQNHNRIGVVKEVLSLPAHDVYVLDIRGREVMIPAVHEFVRRIDLDARVMEVRMIEGMLEES